MKLIPKTSLPDWYVHNEYITTGYRLPNKSFKDCFKSCLTFHNETGNIYTHVIGFLMFVNIFIHTMACNRYHKFESMDKFMFCLYFTATLTCFGMSAMFHAVQCHSIRTFKLFVKLDYIGITLLIMASNIPWHYYAFYNTMTPKVIYMTVTVLLGIGGIYMSLMDKFSSAEYRVIRGTVFILMGLSSIAPFLHFCRYTQFKDPIAGQLAFKAVLLVPLLAALYITGAVLYMIKLPERFSTGMFDLWFHSHQLFHLATIGAGLIYFHSLSLIAEVRLNYSQMANKTSI